MARSKAGEISKGRTFGHEGPGNHVLEFGYFPKESWKVLSCFAPGEVYADMHFRGLSLAGRCSVDWSWAILEA